MRYAQTIAFMALTFISYIQVFNVRHLRDPIWKTELFHNRYLNASVIGVVILQIAIVYIEPVANLLKLETIGFKEWLLVFGCALVTILINEIVKAILRHVEKDKTQAR